MYGGWMMMCRMCRKPDTNAPSTRFMLLLDCVGFSAGTRRKSEDRRNRSTNFQDLFLLVGSLVGIKDIVGTGGRNTFKQVR